MNAVKGIRFRSAAIAWLCVAVLCALPSANPAHGAAATATVAAPVVSVTPSSPTGRYVVGQPISVTVSLGNPGASAGTYNRSEYLQDYFGNVTTVVSDTISLAGGAHMSSTIPVQIAGSGYYEFHVALTDQATQQQATAFAAIGVLRPQPVGVSDNQSAFGINGNLTEAYGTNAAAMAVAAQSMAQAGVRYDREELNWARIEPQAGSGQYSFGASDAAIIAAHNAGIQVLGLLDSWGSLPQPDTTKTITGTYTITGCSKAPACAYTPAGDTLFAGYAAAMVQRYMPGGTLADQQGWGTGYGITDWEVWNEPSTTSFWRHDLVNYVPLFGSLYKAASTAIRQADPSADLMYDESGTAIDNAVKHDGGASQIVSVHSYSGGLDPDSALSSPTLPRGGQGTAPAAIGSIVAQGLPVWITETGYTTDGTVTARQQAEYLVRSIVDFQAQGVKKVFWFKYREDSPGGDNPYGITSQNGAVKPAYLAYATMAEHLQDATYVASAQVGTAVRADLYSATDGSTEVVLWGTAESGTLTIPAGSDMSAVDTMDNPTGQVTAAGLTLALSGDPVFLTATGTPPAQLKTMLEKSAISGINPVGPVVSVAPGLSNGLPNLNVTVSARIDVAISGTVAISLPVGWKAPITSTRFPLLRPGQTSSLSFRLNAEVNHPNDHIAVTATTTTGITNTDTISVAQYALTYGHPAIDGSLTTWGTASELDMIDLQPDQIVGIPGWTPQNLSARVYTMWDEHYFYFAADVHDETFDYAPIGYNMYKGDSIQFGWGLDANAWLRNAGQNRKNLTVGLTHQGAANYQYDIDAPWPDVQQQIKPDPATGDLIYTVAVPWSRLAAYVPKIGNQFAFDTIINQNEHGTRIGWIQITPGMGIGFYTTEFPLWSIIANNPAAGLRLGGLIASNQGLISVPLPTAHGQLVVHNGGMRSITLLINGKSLVLGGTGNPLKPSGDTSVDISPYVHAGNNTVSATGIGTTKAGAAVLAFFQ